MTTLESPKGEVRSSRRMTVPTPAWLLATPAVAAVLAMFVAPFGVFSAYAFFSGGLFQVETTFTLDNFTELLHSDLFRQLLVNSLVNGLITAVAAIVIALPLAFYLHFRAQAARSPIIALLVVSLFASFLARIYSWRALFGDSGFINSVLHQLHLPGFDILFTRTLVVVALIHVALPYVILALYAAMRNLPADLLDVPADLGAGTAQTWVRVVLPLMAPSMVAPFMFTFVTSASDFATPQLLGGTSGSMVGVLIQQQFTDAGDYPLGAAMSLVMLVIFIVAFAMSALVLRILRLHRISTRLA